MVSVHWGCEEDAVGKDKEEVGQYKRRIADLTVELERERAEVRRLGSELSGLKMQRQSEQRMWDDLQQELAWLHQVIKTEDRHARLEIVKIVPHKDRQVWELMYQFVNGQKPDPTPAGDSPEGAPATTPEEPVVDDKGENDGQAE